MNADKKEFGCVTHYITTKAILAHNIHYVNQLYKSIGYGGGCRVQMDTPQDIVVSEAKNHEGGVPRNAVYTPREFRSIFDEITS
jgi:hypothetical protein